MDGASFFFAVLNCLRYSANDLGRAEQTSFDRAYRKRFEQHFNLLANHSRSCRFNPRNFPGNFGDEAGHSGQAINAKDVKGFQVGLNTGPSAAIGPGDG